MGNANQAAQNPGPANDTNQEAQEFLEAAEHGDILEVGSIVGLLDPITDGDIFNAIPETMDLAILAMCANFWNR